MRAEEPGDFNYQSEEGSNHWHVIFGVVDRSHCPPKQYSQAKPPSVSSSSIDIIKPAIQHYHLSQRTRAQQRDNQPRCQAPAWPFSPPPPHQLRSPERPLSLNQNANTSASSAQGLSAEVNTAADTSDRVSGANLFFLPGVYQFLLPPPPPSTPLPAS